MYRLLRIEQRLICHGGRMEEIMKSTETCKVNVEDILKDILVFIVMLTEPHKSCVRGSRAE